MGSASTGRQQGPIPFRTGRERRSSWAGAPFFAVQVGFVTDRRPLTEILDGTSNTIIIGEISVDSFCLGQVTPVGTIEDGTSNTIVVGDGATFDVCIDNARLQQVARPDAGPKV